MNTLRLHSFHCWIKPSGFEVYMYVQVFSLAQIYWKWTELAQGMRYSFLLIYIPQNLKAAKTQAIAHLHLEIVCVKNSMFPLLFCFN